MTKKQRQTYILTKGSYSAYSIVAVCSSKRVAESAEKAATKDMDIRVECVPFINGPVTIVTQWYLSMACDPNDGTATVIYVTSQSRFAFDAPAGWVPHPPTLLSMDDYREVQITGQSKEIIVEAAKKEAERRGLKFVLTKPPEPKFKSDARGAMTTSPGDTLVVRL